MKPLFYSDFLKSIIMQSSLNLIFAERREQIENMPIDAFKTTNGELVQAARCCLGMVGIPIPVLEADANRYYKNWPGGFGTWRFSQIVFRSDIEKLTVAGAFYMAENERTGVGGYYTEIAEIVSRMNDMREMVPQNKQLV